MLGKILNLNKDTDYFFQVLGHFRPAPGSEKYSVIK